MAPAPKLDELIESVRDQIPGTDALDRLEAAAKMSQDLGILSDELLGHFVNEARGSGASWAQIGERLTVTKQAAQQRFAGKIALLDEEKFLASLGLGMFERFNARARNVLVAANAEANNWNHNYIGTEHMLIGLLSEPDGLAAQALDGLGITAGSLREKVSELIGLGKAPRRADAELVPYPIPIPEPVRVTPFTPRARRVLELSLKEAFQLGHNYIGTEHILLGLITEGEGIAAQVLISLGADRGKTRAKILELLTTKGASPGKDG